jgi:pyruvate dehydrogenase E2 component (dihydrolipoamide acetyltransferase)
MEFRLPELGEGITSATVVNLLISAGTAVTEGQTIMEVETDKASMPIPAPSNGTISEVLVKTGDKVEVGAILARATIAAGSPAPAKSEPVAIPTPASKSATPEPVAATTTASAISLQNFTLPNLGEGIDSATIVGISIAVGTTITLDQEAFSVETDKASVPVPAPFAGKVTDIKVKLGDKVPVGAVLAVVEATVAAASTTAPSNPIATVPAAVATIAKPQATTLPTPVATNGQAKVEGPVAASPATRRFAREFGVDLGYVPGSARGGRITMEDVRGFIKGRVSQTPVAATPTSTSTLTPPAMPDFSKYGPVEKKPLSNLRKKIAENLTIAALQIPSVTQQDIVDITDLEAGRKRIVENIPKGSPKVTMTVLAIKAVVAALKEFPGFNCSIDLLTGEQILKQYYHIGIAVDTERGLVVPVIRDADKKSIRDLAKDVNDLAEKARAGKLSIDEMRGGTFTITNLGGIGGTGFTPIVNFPEVAILGLSRSSIQPVYRNNQFEPRMMMPLSLTYDHRIIDGADGARFTTRLVQLFSDPIRLFMES